MSKPQTIEYLNLSYILAGFCTCKNVINFVDTNNGGHSQTSCYWEQQYVRPYVTLGCLACHVARRSYVTATARRKQVPVCVRNIV